MSRMPYPSLSSIEPCQFRPAAGMVKLIVLASLLIGACFGTSARAQTQPADLFPIAAFQQPATLFGGWQSRGVNTMLAYDGGGGYSLDQWNAAAVERGLYQIREPLSNRAADNTNPYLLAWMYPRTNQYSSFDEPELYGVQPSTMAAWYADLKTSNPTKPIFVNYSGGYVLGWQSQAGLSAAKYAQYLQVTDWVGGDIYPVTGWNQPTRIGAVGQMVGRLNAWTNDSKPVIACIETSNQCLFNGSRGVTPDEFRGEVWDSIIHGAKGIVYFSDVFTPQGGWVWYDGTPANVAAEMTKQDALISSLGGVLNSPKDPSAITVRAATPTVETSWRQYNGVDYLFVLNLSPNTLTGTQISVDGFDTSSLQVLNESRGPVSVNSDGTFVDSFAPYELHIYTFDPSISSLVAPALTSASVPSSSFSSGIAGPDVILTSDSVPEPSTALVVGAAAMCLLRRNRARTR